MFKSNGNDISTILNTSALIYWSFGTIFFYCEFGQRLSDLFVEIDHAIGRLDWYLFPNEVQRLLVNFISDTQQPKFIRSYGNILCTREVFKKVNFLKRKQNLKGKILKFNFLFSFRPF